MVTTLCMLVAMAGTAATAEAPGGLPPKSVAILSLQPLGTEQAIVAPLEDILRGEVGQLNGIALQPREATIALVSGSGEACQGDVVCLAKLGQSLGVDYLMYGTVATLGTSYVLDLKLVDIRTRSERGRQSVTLTGDKVIMIDGVRAVSTQLLAPAQYVGSLELNFATPGAEVFVDGKTVGRTPLRPLSNLAPGTHGLKIVLKGFNDFDRFVEIKFGRTTVVNVSMSGNTLDAVIEGKPQAAPLVEAPIAPQTAPALAVAPRGPPILLLTGAGVAVLGSALLAGGTAILVTMYTSMLPYTRSAGNATVVTDPEAYGALVQAYNGWYWLGYAIGGTGLGLLATGGALAIWDLLATPAAAP